MKKIIVILCGVIWASEAVAVTQIIPAGEDVTGGDVHTVVTQQVYGTTRNFTVSGNQQGNEKAFCNCEFNVKYQCIHKRRADGADGRKYCVNRSGLNGFAGFFQKIKVGNDDKRD